MALILLTMAVGPWSWLFAPAAPASAVATPRLHVAATQVEAATTAPAAEHAAAAGDEANEAAAEHTIPGDHAVAPFIAIEAQPPARGTSPAVGGPRAPPVAS